jgi:hypothetical protein
MDVRRFSLVASVLILLFLLTGCTTSRIPTSAPHGSSSSTAGTPFSNTSTQPRSPSALNLFDPLSFTAVSLQTWWLLGSIPCDKSQRCPEIVRTTDGGTHFERVAAPNSGLVVNGPMVSGLRFADASHGWAFGPGLWSTDNGGLTWTRQQVTGTVVDVEAAEGQAYALVCTTRSTSCLDMALLRSAVSGGSWSVVSLPAPLFAGTELAVQGGAVYIMNGVGGQQGSQASSLLVSTDGGRNFVVEQSGCFAGLGGHVQPAITGGGVLWESCPTGMMTQPRQSNDDGKTWHVLVTNSEFSNGLSFAAVSAHTALAWPYPPSGGLGLTTDGGETFRTVFQGPSGSTLFWAGYSDPSRAYLLVATNTSPYNGQLWESNDGGVTWSQVNFNLRETSPSK